MIRLLDINVLLALAWPNHIHHDSAHIWFAQCREEGWATCPVTQSGFVRLSSTPAITGKNLSIRDVIEGLSESTRSPHHHFWPHNRPVTQLVPELVARLAGPKQITDALLLDLAIERGGIFATFDRRIESLLPTRSPLRGSIEMISIPGDE